ncbi:MAG: VOC family protein [Chthoniobacterales bacterium]
MIQGLHHTSFTVSNLEETERFFVDLFGMTRIAGGLYDFDYIRKIIGFPEGVLNISVVAFPAKEGVPSPHVLELIEYAKSAGTPTDTATNRPGNAHLCFLVDDIHSEYQRLKALGVKFRSEPQEVTFGVNNGAWAVYFNGPDDIALELLQPRQK